MSEGKGEQGCRCTGQINRLNSAQLGRKLSFADWINMLRGPEIAEEDRNGRQSMPSIHSSAVCVRVRAHVREAESLWK